MVSNKCRILESLPRDSKHGPPCRGSFHTNCCCDGHSCSGQTEAAFNSLHTCPSTMPWGSVGQHLGVSPLSAMTKVETFRTAQPMVRANASRQRPFSVEGIPNLTTLYDPYILPTCVCVCVCICVYIYIDIIWVCIYDTPSTSPMRAYKAVQTSRVPCSGSLAEFLGTPPAPE